MRILFIAVALALACGCVKAPYYDLRQPIYMVTDNSLWVDCDKDKSVPEKDCRQYRIDQIEAGVSQWFSSFDENNRPRVVVVASEKDIPPHQVNRVIHLGVSDTFCGDVSKHKPAAACYNWVQHWWSWQIYVRIVFKTDKEIMPRVMAHEFGHGLGLDDNYAPAAYGSVMSYTLPTPVTQFDIKMMCKLHHECRMVKRKVKK